jgi:hypothetical protein
VCSETVFLCVISLLSDERGQKTRSNLECENPPANEQGASLVLMLDLGNEAGPLKADGFVVSQVRG